MKTEGLVLLERRGATAIISLNRPQRHNALIPELLAELLAILQHDDCQAAAAVLLRAEGRSFSIGGDLHGFLQHRETIGQYSLGLVALLNQVILAIYTHPAPVVCAVHGQVTGGSLGFLLAADRVIMRRGVTITPYYSVVGFSPDGGWTALLPDTIGRQQTLHWLASNASHDADHCLQLGLVHQVVDENCDAAALAWTEKLTGMQPGSIIRTRRLLNTDLDSIRQRLEAELKHFVSQVQTQQALDGIEHFLRRELHE